jgi:hypothetical protein
MGAKRNSKRLIVAAITIAGVAGGAMVANADPFSSRAYENTTATYSGPQDLSVTPAPVWPAIAPTCTVGAVCDVDLVAGKGLATVPNHAAVPFYGFGVNGAAPALAGADGSVIKVPLGTVIHITLDNQLGQDLDLSFPSLANVTPTATGYDVTADKLGTMVFQPGANDLAPRQAAMGLVGVLIVTPTTPGALPTDPAVDCSACAYDAAAPFDEEALVAMTDLDPLFAADPLHYDMSYFGQARDAAQDKRDVFHAINGKVFPDTDVIDVKNTDDLLLRYVNAGVSDKYMGVLGTHQTVLSRNTAKYQAPQTMVAPLVGPGETADVSVHIPDNAIAGQKYSLMDQGRHMGVGSASGFGNALTFIDVWTGTSPTVDGLAFDLGAGTLTANGHSSGVANVLTGYQTAVTADGSVPPETAWAPRPAAMLAPPAVPGDPVAITALVPSAVDGDTVWVRVQQGSLFSAPASVLATAAPTPPTVAFVSFDSATYVESVTATATFTGATILSFEAAFTANVLTLPTTWLPVQGTDPSTFVDASTHHGEVLWIRATDTNNLISTVEHTTIPYVAPTLNDSLSYSAGTLTGTGTVDAALVATSKVQYFVNSGAPLVDPVAWVDGTGSPSSISELVTALPGDTIWARVIDGNGGISPVRSVSLPVI